MVETTELNAVNARTCCYSSSVEILRQTEEHCSSNTAKISTSQVQHLPLKGNPVTSPIHLKVDFADAPSSGNIIPLTRWM